MTLVCWIYTSWYHLSIMSFSCALIFRKCLLNSSPSPFDNLKSTNREAFMSIRLTFILSFFCLLSVVNIVTWRGELTVKLYLRLSRASFNLNSVFSGVIFVWKRVILLTSLWNGVWDAPGVHCICVLSSMWSGWTGCEKHKPFMVLSLSTLSKTPLPIPLSRRRGSGWDAEMCSWFPLGRTGERTSASVHLRLNGPVPLGVPPGEQP